MASTTTHILKKDTADWRQYAHMPSCGQLIIAANMSSYALKCIFCESICLRLRAFIEHVLEQHADDVLQLHKELPANEEDTEDAAEVLSHTEQAIDRESPSAHFNENETKYLITKQDNIEEFTTLDENYDASIVHLHEEVLLEVDVAEIYEVEDEHSNEQVAVVVSNEAAVLDETYDNQLIEVIKYEEPDLEEIVSNDLNALAETSVVDKEVAAVDIINEEHDNQNIDVAAAAAEDIDEYDIDDDDVEDVDDDNDDDDDDEDDEYSKPAAEPLGIDVHNKSNRPLLLYIINEFRDNPVLWDTLAPAYTRTRNERALKALCSQIKAKFNLTLGYRQVRKVFIALRRLHYNETKRLKANEKSGNSANASNLWCFQDIEFVNNIKKRTSLQLPLKTIARIYKMFPPLWNMKETSYRDRALRAAKLEEMRLEVNSALGTKANTHQLMVCIRRLRRYYSKNNATRLNCQLNKRTYTPSYPQYVEALSYLDGHVGPFLCNICQTISANYDNHVMHMNKHTGRADYTCEYCSKNFKNQGNLKIHRRIHTRDLPYACETCGKKFTNSGSLKVHVRVHSDERPYICDICGKQYRTCSFLARHKMYHNRESWRFKCDICGRMFGEKQRLREHENAHLGRREFTCDACGKGFFAQKTLRQHEQIHGELKQHACEMCEMTFAQRAGLFSHMRRIHQTLNTNIS